MSSKLSAKSLPYIPGYTVWENANGLGRPGYLPGSGNQYVDTVESFATIDEGGAQVIACLFLFVVGVAVGGQVGYDAFGGHGAVIGIFLGAAGGLTVGYFLGLFLVRLVAVLMVLIPFFILLWIAGDLLVQLWNS